MPFVCCAASDINIDSDSIQLREEVVEAENVDQVSPDLIQINTNLQEVEQKT